MVKKLCRDIKKPDVINKHDARDEWRRSYIAHIIYVYEKTTDKEKHYEEAVAEYLHPHIQSM